jgi:hypothetical protein
MSGASPTARNRSGRGAGGDVEGGGVCLAEVREACEQQVDRSSASASSARTDA